MDWKDYFNRDLGVFDYDRFYADGGTETDLPDTIRDNEDNPKRNRGNISVSGDIDGDETGGLTGYGDFLEGLIEPWEEETDPIRETFREWLQLEGVSPGDEGAIATFAQDASTRAADAAGGTGMFFSGQHAGEQQGIWQGTMRDVLQERRKRTETAGGILSGLSGQLADMLGRGITGGASITSAESGQAPFGGQWSRRESDIARETEVSELDAKFRQEQLRRMQGENTERGY